MGETPKTNENKEVRESYSIGALGYLIAICAVAYLFMAKCSHSEYFTGTETATGLFSALAFAGVIYAIFLQKKELSLQRKELELTRGEFKEQNKTLRLQRFENTFFQMLSLQQEIVNTLSLSHVTREYDPNYDIPDHVWKFKGEKIILGREVFWGLYRKYKTDYIPNRGDVYMNTTIHSLYNSIESEGLDALNNKDELACLDHYFRHLYRIVKFVDESPLLDTFEERYQYTSILRGQLSRYELILLFYNCLSNNGKDKFKPLVERYTLLKGIMFDELVSLDEHKALFAPSAFERTESV